MILKFIWYVFSRFAKTFGLLFIIAGISVAAWFYQQRTPMIEAVRYRQSNLLSERLQSLDSIYGDSQRLVMKFKAAGEFPADYAAAGFKPQFPQTYSSQKDFQDLQSQLAQVKGGKDVMKRFVTEHFESLLNDIQQKLMAHAAALAPTPAPGVQAKPAPTVTFTPDYGLYDNRINSSEIEGRKFRLNDAKQFLGVLQSSAENEENKKTLGDSISEIDALEKLFPSNIDQPLAPPVNFTPTEVREPLNAEKVAARVAAIRNNVRQAVLSSWALDEANDRALQTAEDEQGKFSSSELRVKQLTEQLHLAMAAALTGGLVLGMFFLLIGDWTQKSSTEIHSYSAHLIKDFTASSKEVYDIIEQHIAARQVPELESTRQFWHEGGALSAKREYLRLARERLVFDICAAPFGTGFFISFRCSEIPLTIDPLAIFLTLALIGAALIALVSAFGLMWGAIILVFSLSLLLFITRTAVARGLGNVDRVLMKTPLIAPLYEFFLRPVTYYRIDSIAMYLQAVQGATSEAFQSIFGEQGVNLLPETVAKPVLDAIYRRRFP